MFEEVRLLHAFDLRNRPENRVQGAQAERRMIRDRKPMTSRRVRLQDDVLDFLVDAPVAEIAAEDFDEVGAAAIAGQLHAGCKSSSRTRCKRMAAGLGWSKK